MTAVEHVAHDNPPPAQHPLAPGASTDVIREHLLDEDRAQFDAELRGADASPDRDRLWRCVEHWRNVAVIQSDRAAFTRMVRRAAERNTGEPSPRAEPLEVSRRKAGM